VPQKETAFWKREFWPLFSLVAIAAFCFTPTLDPVLAGQLYPKSLYEFGRFLSNGFWNSYIFVTIVVLLLPYGRFFSGEKGKKVRTFWWVLDVAATTFLFITTTKFLTQAPRPNGQPSGFISGHTAFAIGLAFLVKETYPKLTPLWFIMALAVAWSRIEEHAHFPYQVVLGEITGLCIGWGVSRMVNGIIVPRLVRRIKPKPVRA